MMDMIKKPVFYIPTLILFLSLQNIQFGRLSTGLFIIIIKLE